VIETESQAVLKTLTEHNVQAAFTKYRGAGNSEHARKKTTCKKMVAGMAES
jgi:hypothetical protein